MYCELKAEKSQNPMIQIPAFKSGCKKRDDRISGSLHMITGTTVVSNLVEIQL